MWARSDAFVKKNWETPHTKKAWGRLTFSKKADGVGAHVRMLI